jgi:hypothetical protein
MSNKEQVKKVYSVKEVETGKVLYIKAKSKLAALRFAVGNMYEVAEVNAKNAEGLAQALAGGSEILEA